MKHPHPLILSKAQKDRAIIDSLFHPVNGHSLAGVEPERFDCGKYRNSLHNHNYVTRSMARLAQMNPLDRITQLTERAENAEKQCDIVQRICESAQREVALLRSQLADARQQLERDSATIAKLAKDKQELVSALRRALDGLQQEQNRNKSVSVATLFLALNPILSRHA